MLSPIIFSVIVFFAVMFIIIAGYYIWQRKESLKEQSERIEKVVNIQTEIRPDPNASNTEGVDSDQTALRRDMRISAIPWLNTLLSKFLKEKAKSLMHLIEQSGLRIKVSEFVLFTVLVSLIVILAIYIFTHNLFISLAGIGAVFLPYWILGFLKERRINTFVNQLSPALDLLSSDLRAGLDVQTGLKHLSEEFPAPLGEEFAKVIVEINLGVSLSDALNNLSKRVSTMDVQILCTGIIINRELGGNLSELIGSIANTVRERFRLKGLVKALTAESQMSAMLLIFLPIGLFILLNIMAPSTYNSFMSDPKGQAILAGCVVSMTFGYIVIQKITKLEV